MLSLKTVTQDAQVQNSMPTELSENMSVSGFETSQTITPNNLQQIV